MKYKKLDRRAVDEVCALQEKYFSDGWNKAQLESGFETGRFFVLGAYRDDEMIGFISYSISDVVADLEDLLIVPEFRNKGIATALFQMMLDEISGKASRIMLEVRQSNAKAIGLYEKLGFKEISQRKKYYADGETAIVYCKEI